jgi:putative oxidoreductase
MHLAPETKDSGRSFFIPEEIIDLAAGIFPRGRWSVQVKAGIFERRILNMNNQIKWLLHPPLDGPRATILIRVMAGTVFFWEGIMKFVFANQGVGRFTKLGFPAPHFTATADGWFEIVGGILLIAGLLTRVIAIPFIIEMLVAMASTKIPMYLGTSPLPLPPVPPQIGFWAVLHEIRSEYAQLASCAFLLLAGPGRWSVDAMLSRRGTDEVAGLRRSVNSDARLIKAA